MGELKIAKCPAVDCYGDIRVSTDLPEGVYACICQEVRVRLRWTTMADFSRRPYLSVADCRLTGEDGSDG